MDLNVCVAPYKVGVIYYCNNFYILYDAQNAIIKQEMQQTKNPPPKK